MTLIINVSTETEVSQMLIRLINTTRIITLCFTEHSELSANLAAYHLSGLYWIWSKRKPKVALVFLLTPQIQVKDFVLLAFLKYHKELYQCPLWSGLITIIVLFQRGEAEEKIEGWWQERHKKEREAQEGWAHAGDTCQSGRGSICSGGSCSNGGRAWICGGCPRANIRLSDPLAHCRPWQTRVTTRVCPRRPCLHPSPGACPNLSLWSSSDFSSTS